MRPLIGITCVHDWKNDVLRQNHTYVHAVEKAGGAPILLPCITDEAVVKSMVARLDGVLVAGGPDMGSEYFNEEPIKALGAISPLMDAFEVLLINHAIALKKPILGICRGEQTLNVALGGTLYQDIYSQKENCLKHRQEAPRDYTAHKVSIDNNSYLASLLGQDIRVNTFHHQAVKDVAPGLKAVAWAPDGIIEAIESFDRDTFVVGVQWHPEGMWNATYNYDALFNAFVAAASIK